MDIYKWGHQRRFNSYPEYFKSIFGTRVQKVTINAGFTCPNRDGTKGVGGCTYCNNEAFNPSYCSPEKSVREQILNGIHFHKVRYRHASKFLAYFQAYSNTYGDINKLKNIFEEALSVDKVAGIVIGTRPDCIDDEKLEYLSKLSEKHYIIIEYGIESCYDRSLELINRCHNYVTSKQAVIKTKKHGINTGAHMIIGLPGESENDILEGIGKISELPLDTIKFHQLQIHHNTALAKEYLSNPEKFNLFSLNDYLELIVKIIERLNPDFIIERFASETPPKYKIGPDWGSVRNPEIQRMVEKKLEEKNTWQGKYYKNT